MEEDYKVDYMVDSTVDYKVDYTVDYTLDYTVDYTVDYMVDYMMDSELPHQRELGFLGQSLHTNVKQASPGEFSTLDLTGRSL